MNPNSPSGDQSGLLLSKSKRADHYARDFMLRWIDRFDGGIVRVVSLARFSTPDSNRDRVIPRAPEIFTKLRKLKLVSPRSIVPMKVL